MISFSNCTNEWESFEKPYNKSLIASMQLKLAGTPLLNQIGWAVARRGMLNGRKVSKHEYLMAWNWCIIVFTCTYESYSHGVCEIYYVFTLSTQLTWYTQLTQIAYVKFIHIYTRTYAKTYTKNEQCWAANQLAVVCMSSRMQRRPILVVTFVEFMSIHHACGFAVRSVHRAVCCLFITCCEHIACRVMHVCFVRNFEYVNVQFATILLFVANCTVSAIYRCWFEVQCKSM